MKELFRPPLEWLHSPFHPTHWDGWAPAHVHLQPFSKRLAEAVSIKPPLVTPEWSLGFHDWQPCTPQKAWQCFSKGSVFLNKGEGVRSAGCSSCWGYSLSVPLKDVRRCAASLPTATADGQSEDGNLERENIWGSLEKEEALQNLLKLHLC